MGAARLLVIQHIPDDHLNELAGPLSDNGLLIETWFPPRQASPSRDLTDYDGVLSLGAVVGVNDEADHPWMSAERGLLERAMAIAMPTLGVCFGAQLLASIGGAQVRSAESPEVGWTQVQMDPYAARDPVLSALGPCPHVFQYHHDTFTAPPAGAVLGRTALANQVLRIGESTWGLQFHIEVSPGAIYSWLGTFGEDMRANGAEPDLLVAETARRWKDYRVLATGVADAFAQRVTAYADQTRA